MKFSLEKEIIFSEKLGKFIFSLIVLQSVFLLAELLVYPRWGMGFSNNPNDMIKIISFLLDTIFFLFKAYLFFYVINFILKKIKNRTPPPVSAKPCV
jgi:hypothetical protein